MNEELYQALIAIAQTQRLVRAKQNLVDHYQRFFDAGNENFADDLAEAKAALAKVTPPFQEACERFIAAYNAIYHKEAQS